MSNKKVFATIGASNHTNEPRANYDYYATDPRAVLELLKKRALAMKYGNPLVEKGIYLKNYPK